MANIFPILAFKDNYIWCLEKDSRCVVVDPGDAGPVIKTLNDRNLTLTAILVTHHHFDHTGGIKNLLAHKKVPVYGPQEIPQVTAPISPESKLNLREIDHTFLPFEIPGHTLEHMGYYDAGIVFTGDTLFTGGCGKIFEGTAEQMYQSLMKLKALPDETLVYCGHEYTENNLRFALEVEPNNPDIHERYAEVKALRAKNLPTVPASLGIEKKTNPFLRCDQKDVVEAAIRYMGVPLTNPVDVLCTIRDFKNNFI